jgi:hypothetical protein
MGFGSADVRSQSENLVIVYAITIFSIVVLYFLFIYKVRGIMVLIQVAKPEFSILTAHFLVSKVTYNVTGPMMVLLRTVKAINERIMGHDIPPLHGGSREVHQVYACFAKIVRAVQMSNTAFFSVDLLWAIEFVK